MSSVTVTHSDLSTTVYANYFAGISTNPGDGWQLCLMPQDPTSQRIMIIPLATGDSYQTTGTLPAASAYPNYQNLLTKGILPVGTSKQVTYTAPTAAISVAPTLAHGVTITHPDGSTDSYPNMLCGVAANQGNGWFLCLINGDATLEDGKKRKAASVVIPLRDGDTYQNTGTMPPAWIYANREILWHTVPPIGKVLTAKKTVFRT